MWSFDNFVGLTAWRAGLSDVGVKANFFADADIIFLIDQRASFAGADIQHIHFLPK